MSALGVNQPFHVIIPARWQSSRLPGKMLADIGGLPMVVRTALQARKSSARSVTIAADDARIIGKALEHGIDAVLTRSDHPSGTDRLAEAAELLGLREDAHIINVQGDEPMINPAIIDEVAHALAQDTEASIATCASRLSDESALSNPNVVKVVRDLRARALYFSRSAIPHVRGDVQTDVSRTPYLHHIGIYGYRSNFLEAFPQLTPGLLESLEMLEQLRALEHGFKIHVCVTDNSSFGGVDTPDDLERVRRMFSPQPSA
ncbi:3-deoxy-manno-octulosonate cytidylyltransferase [Orrella marina]|uniref:3-deoxy-manno-octulosonate cytidylyltransferase n=1 Tax=Orrella marina TaxID=2163011 RepID=A0A2R4XHU4_9BURK|nr:3-deoxy-manno-octulosonate cytidylyltransferase [Orrella marina]AWB33361.1 3-deoxy-manno-octulosonate cytidylyltransferase [Orrella marina]